MPRYITLKKYCERKRPGFIEAHTDRGAARAVVTNYWLEALDDEHRPAEYLQRHFVEWRRLKPENQLTADDDFFTWLNDNEAKAKAKPPRIQYWEQNDRSPFKAQIGKDDKIYVGGAVCDTRRCVSRFKPKGYAAFVVTTNGNLYIHEHQKNKVAHATFKNGEKVLCAGLLRIKAGKITDINNWSGHYRPRLLNLFEGIRYISNRVFAPEATVTHMQMRFPDLVEKWVNSENVLLRLLGRGLGNLCKVTAIAGRDNFLRSAHGKLTDQGINHSSLKKRGPRIKRLAGGVNPSVVGSPAQFQPVFAAGPQDGDGFLAESSVIAQAPAAEKRENPSFFAT